LPGAFLVRETTREVRFIPGGTFRMGSDRRYPEEAPVREVAVGRFRIDRTPVTHRQFRQFVNETGNVTLRSGQSARGGRRDELRPAPAQYQVSAQGAPKAARTCALRTIAAVPRAAGR
jgi:formylglycine-generating enzyme required for sulfatase activity